MSHYHQNGKIFAPAAGDPSGYGGCIQVDLADLPEFERLECDECAELEGRTEMRLAA